MTIAPFTTSKILRLQKPAGHLAENKHPKVRQRKTKAGHAAQIYGEQREFCLPAKFTPPCVRGSESLRER